MCASAYYWTALETSLKDWLLGLGVRVGDRTIRNVFYGDFEAQKGKDKLPLIEFDFDLQNSRPLSIHTQETQVRLIINIWSAGARNKENIRKVRDAAEIIAAAFQNNFATLGFGYLPTSFSFAIDPEPLYTEAGVGCQMTVEFVGSIPNTRTVS